MNAYLKLLNQILIYLMFRIMKKYHFHHFIKITKHFLNYWN